MDVSLGLYNTQKLYYREKQELVIEMRNLSIQFC